MELQATHELVMRGREWRQRGRSGDRGDACGDGDGAHSGHAVNHRLGGEDGSAMRAEEMTTRLPTFRVETAEATVME